MNWPITLPSGKRMNLSLVMFAMPRADNGKTAAWFGGGDDDLLTIEGSDWPAFCAAWAEYEAACRARYGCKNWDEAPVSEDNPMLDKIRQLNQEESQPSLLAEPQLIELGNSYDPGIAAGRSRCWSCHTLGPPSARECPHCGERRR